MNLFLPIGLLVTLLEVSVREEGAVAIHRPIGSLKPRSVVEAGTEMRTQYLPAHRLMI